MSSISPGSADNKFGWCCLLPDLQRSVMESDLAQLTEAAQPPHRALYIRPSLHRTAATSIRHANTVVRKKNSFINPVKAFKFFFVATAVQPGPE